MLYDILFLHGCGNLSCAPSLLLLVLIHRSPLDVTRICGSYDHIFFRYEIFRFNRLMNIQNLCPSVITILFFQFLKIIPDYVKNPFFGGQDVLKVFYQLQKPLVFLLNLILFQRRKLLQLHVQDCL